MAKRKRRHSGFQLDPLTVVEKDIAIDHVVGFAKRGRFMPVDAFGLENREEVFGHGIVIAVATS